MAETGENLRQSRSFMGASVSFRLGLAAACLALLWSGVWWALAS